MYFALIFYGNGNGLQTPFGKKMVFSQMLAVFLKHIISGRTKSIRGNVLLTGRLIRLEMLARAT